VTPNQKNTNDPSALSSRCAVNALTRSGAKRSST
jgi:hypothetical protein